jgi:hypothetical protein
MVASYRAIAVPQSIVSFRPFTIRLDDHRDPVMCDRAGATHLRICSYLVAAVGVRSLFVYRPLGPGRRGRACRG